MGAMAAANSGKATVCFLLLLLLLPIALVEGGHSDGPSQTCENHVDEECAIDKDEALKLRVVGLVVILLLSAFGVCLPMLGRWFPFLSAGSNVFYIVKAFAAGVILSTGLVHVLPSAFDQLGSPCLKENPWHKFPFAGFVAMVAAMGTLMLESGATGYYERAEARKNVVANVEGGGGDLEVNEVKEERVEEVPAHAVGHGHGHGPFHGDPASELMRHRIISQVLELGIIAHSVIIGIAMGASENPCTIKPVIVALCFHQFFEGMGLGGCIVQAKFKPLTSTLMVIFFSITTPIGIAVGIGVASTYNENNATTLIVQGIFNAASAGILIYMSLVDLLAADYSTHRIRSSFKLQTFANISLLLGAGIMSLIGLWD